MSHALIERKIQHEQTHGEKFLFEINPGGNMYFVWAKGRISWFDLITSHRQSGVKISFAR